MGVSTLLILTRYYVMSILSLLSSPLSLSLSRSLFSTSPLPTPPLLQLKNVDYFSQYVTDEDFEHYINRKRFDNCYGNNVEMQAIAEIYNRSIEVFQYTTGMVCCHFHIPFFLCWYHGEMNV